MSKRLWKFFLLIYSLSLLILLVPGVPGLLGSLLIPFYLFVPGHAMGKHFFRDLDVYEDITMSVGLSVALFVSVRGVIQTFRLAGMLSELPILVAISAVSLVAGIASSK